MSYTHCVKHGRFPKGQHIILWSQKEILRHLKFTNVGTLICQDGSEAFAICSLLLLPPKNIDPPYVSAKQIIDGKSYTIYPACRTCMETQNETRICHHNDEERALYTTLCTQEINFCVEELHYRIVEIFGR